MASVSTVPACVDAIVARLRARPALEGVQIVDGQPLTTDPDVITIGFTGEPGETAVESTRTAEQLMQDPARESYDIICLASSWRGDTDAKVVRDRAYALVDEMAAELAADQTLGGVVAMARLTADDLAQEQTSQGAVATVRFTVHVDAWTRR